MNSPEKARLTSFIVYPGIFEEIRSVARTKEITNPRKIEIIKVPDFMKAIRDKKMNAETKKLPPALEIPDLSISTE